MGSGLMGMRLQGIRLGVGVGLGLPFQNINIRKLIQKADDENND